MFFTLVPILCVHVSLWTYIFMIGVYLETYTHESSYIFNWYSNSLVTTLFITFDSLVVSKRHKLCFSFGIPFWTLISLWTYLLQLLGCVYGKTWYALCATYIERLCWCYAHLCISLLKCLSLSHPSIFGWASLYLSLLSLVAQHFLVASCFASFLSLSLLDRKSVV